MALQNYATDTMTCLDRYLGDYCRIDSHVFHWALYRDGLSNDLYLTANWRDSVNYSIKEAVVVIVDGVYYVLGSLSGWADPVLKIAMTGNVPPYISLYRRMAADDLYYNGTKNEPIALSVGQYAVLPQAAFSQTLYAGYSHTLTWTITAGEGRTGWATGAELRYRSPGSGGFTTVPLFANEKKASCTLTTEVSLLGKEACVMLEYRTFAPGWNGTDLEAFVTLNRYVTPLQLVDTDASKPLPPAAITTSIPLAGGNVAVRWPGAVDALYEIPSYVVECARQVDGVDGGFRQLYRGAALACRDTLPEKIDAVRYRVCSVERGGMCSDWTDTGWIQVEKSNLYVGYGGGWRPVSAIWIGQKKASPMAVLG